MIFLLYQIKRIIQPQPQPSFVGQYDFEMARRRLCFLKSTERFEYRLLVYKRTITNPAPAPGRGWVSMSIYRYGLLLVSFGCLFAFGDVCRHTGVFLQHLRNILISLGINRYFGLADKLLEQVVKRLSI